MEQGTEVVPIVQGSPDSPHQRGTGTYLNPEGGYLQAAPTIGRTNTSTGTTGKYHRWASGRRGYCKGSAETMGRPVGSNIGYEGRTPEDMSKGRNQG